MSYRKILKAEHCALVSAFIRSQLDKLDAYQSDSETSLSDEMGDVGNVTGAAPRITTSTSTFRSGDHFVLGSYRGNLTIRELLKREAGDDAFTSFCTRVSVAIKNLDPTGAVVIDESYRVCYID